VPSELGDDMQVNPNGSGRVMTNLEILQHPLSKWGHDEISFRCEHTTNDARPAGGLVQYVIQGVDAGAKTLPAYEYR